MLSLVHDKHMPMETKEAEENKRDTSYVKLLLFRVLTEVCASLPAYLMPPVRELQGLELLKYKTKARISEDMRHCGLFIFKRKRFVKRGSRVRLQEGLTMHYIAQNTTIRVPRVLDVFTINGVLHIAQEFIDGPVLEDVWSRLSPEDQHRSMAQLKNCLDQLRALQSPHPERVQAVDGSGLIDGRLENGVWGPFNDHAAFHRFLNHDVLCARPESYPNVQEALSRVHGNRYKTVFSHGDLGLHNILWKDGHIVIIDWERSGWFPEYWDYTMVHAARGHMVGWWTMFKETVDYRHDDEVELALRISEYFEPTCG
jgi:tRNA A-37 threonylcarbamoyl transferase component Bud32